MSNKVTVMPGVAGIKAVYEKALTEERVDFICTASDYDRLLDGWYEKDFAPRLAKSGVKVREILGGDGERCIASESEGDVIVAQDWVALVSFDAQAPMVVVLEDKEMVRGFSDRFEALWER